MTTFVVYLLTQDIESNENLQLLEQCFSHSSFLVKTMKIDPLPGSLPNNIDREDTHRLLICLRDSEHSYPDQSFLIIKENSFLTNHNSADVATLLQKTDRSLRSEQIPFCYLSKWNESCDENPQTRQVIIKRHSNHFQALLITPMGREILLQRRAMKNGNLFQIKEEGISDTLIHALTEGHIEVTCLQPPLVVCHSSLVTTSTQKILQEREKEKEKNLAEGFSIWVYIVIVGIFLLILFGLAFFCYRRYYY